MQMIKNIILLISLLSVIGCSSTPPVPPIIPEGTKVQIDPKLLEPCGDALELVSGDELANIAIANLQTLGECKKKNKSLVILLKNITNNSDKDK